MQIYLRPRCPVVRGCAAVLDVGVDPVKQGKSCVHVCVIDLTTIEDKVAEDDLVHPVHHRIEKAEHDTACRIVGTC